MNTQTLDLKVLKTELTRIQSLFDQVAEKNVKIDMNYKVDEDGHLAITLDFDGYEQGGYIEFTPEEGYEEIAAMGIDATNVFEKYNYSANELKKIKLPQVKAFIALAEHFVDN